jgi:hypothetical protein
MVSRERREAFIRMGARKLSNRVRRESMTKCTVQMDPEGESLAPPFSAAAPWVARIRDAEDHEVLLSVEGLRISSREGTVELRFDRVSSWEWLALRTRNKLRDGNRIAVQLTDGGEVIAHAPGWAWSEFHYFFARLLPRPRGAEQGGGLQKEQ